ncbi:MAG: hypothetical protein GY925_16875 [Actinomycetia bacterium]|nr:hypothetical protein [Actinomycetes bacterium]
MGAQLYVGAGDLSNDSGNVDTIATPRGIFDVTGLDKYAKETLLGLAEGILGFGAFFNTAAGQAHPILSALPTSDEVITFAVGSTAGSPAASMIGPQLNYDANRPGDGSFTFSTTKAGNGYGLDWGELLTAGKVTSTGAEDLASVDFGAAGTNGLVAYLHVFAFTGTSVTVTIEESSDDGGGDAFTAVTGGAFTAASAVGSQRIETADSLAVEQYLQVALTGTYSNAVLAVVVKPRDAAEIL